MTSSATVNTGLPPSVTLAQLVAGGATFDGQTLLVTGSYYSANGQQVLCDGFMESYPPQPSGNQIGLAGNLPDLVLQQLQSTRGDPTMAQAVWGQVSVIGIFHASAGASEAFMEMQSVRVETGREVIID
jgi:hypothetical protein